MKKKKDKIIKAWAVIRDTWKEDGWNNPLFECALAVRAKGTYFTLAIFGNKRDAMDWNRLSRVEKSDKVVPVQIKITKDKK